MMKEALSAILKKLIEDRCGQNIPMEISARIQAEWKVIQANGWEEDFLRAYWSTQALCREGVPWIFPGVDGGCSLVAFLLGLTQVNPLPPHYYCPQCKRIGFVPDTKDGFDLPETVCGNCGGIQHGDGHQCDFPWFQNRGYAPFRECRIPDRGISVIAKALSTHMSLTPMAGLKIGEKYCFDGWFLTVPGQFKNDSWVEVDDPLHSGKKVKAVIDDYELRGAYPFFRIFHMDGLDLLDQLCQKAGVKTGSVPVNEVGS